MSVVLVGNTKSGRGLATRLVHRFGSALRNAGVDCTILSLSGTDEAPRFEPDRFRGARAILAIGGDGTVNAITDTAIRTATPVYHVPSGNENLIARRYGMTRDPNQFLRALGEHRVIHADVGNARSGRSNRRFLIMATVGPDARVIERLHHTRTKAVGHLAYVQPVLREALSPYLPPLRVTVDGKRVVDGRKGWLIIANDREYAARLNFATDAGPENRSLSAIFLPANNLADCTAWTLRAWLRRHARDPRFVQASGTEITIETSDTSDGPLRFQIDGEYDAGIPDRSLQERDSTQCVQVVLDNARLPILIPNARKL